MPNMPAWSYSALTSFETCPRRHYLTKVSKQVVEPQTVHTVHGNEVHKAFEDSVKAQQPLPAKYAEYQGLATVIMQAPGQRHTELQLAINRSFQPVKWFAKDAWCRGIVDVAVENKDRAWAGDYKTGKRKPESTQLQLFTALLFHHKPYLNKIKSSFIWLKEKKMDTEEFSRDQLGNIWQEFVPRVERMKFAFENDKWVPRPSGLCGWCPVGRAHCEFWKERR